MAATGERCGGAHDRLLSIGVAAACAAWLLAADPGRAADENGEPGHSGAELMDLSVQELLDVNVEEVRGASLRKQLVADAPASVTIVDSDEIKKYGYRTLADILASVPGLFLGYDRNYATVGIRGFQRPSDFNSRILLLLDGHRLNDDIFTGAAIGTDFIFDVDLIDRVEVIRGPASALYGTSAFFGVVNVISRDPAQIGGVEISTSAGSLGTYQGRLSYGHRFDSGVGVVASGTFFDSQGHDTLYYPEFDDPSTNFGVAENLDGDRAGRFFAAVTYTDLTVTGAYDLRDKDVPTASFGAIFDDPRYQTRDAQGFADVRWEHEFAGSVTALARAYYDHYDTRGRYPYDVADPGDPPDTVLNVDRAVGELAGVETRLTKLFAGGHRVAAGLEYRNDLRQD
ncbi:MAG: TonB-dependent receptor plug domain-containing protein, partial [Deltaproteobacteria bacterium]|nr:TonB-dependent receptor plug domain-containing protein [Deltaproteobacteria bacterium]